MLRGAALRSGPWGQAKWARLWGMGVSSGWRAWARQGTPAAPRRAWAAPAPGQSSGGPPSPPPPATASCYRAHLGQCQPKLPCLFSLPPPRPSLNSKCVWALPGACTCLLGVGGAAPTLPHLCAGLKVA